MGFTNHTSNYELGQYVGTDIPSYLTDWNDTMSQIDTAIKNTADSASGLATRLSAVEAQQTLDVADIAQAKSDITTNATAITSEAADRAAADTALGVRVGANESAITALQGDVSNLNTDVSTMKAVKKILTPNASLSQFDHALKASDFTYETALSNSGAAMQLPTEAHVRIAPAVGAKNAAIACYHDPETGKIAFSLPVILRFYTNDSNAVVSFTSDVAYNAAGNVSISLADYVDDLKTVIKTWQFVDDRGNLVDLSNATVDRAFINNYDTPTFVNTDWAIFAQWLGNLATLKVNIYSQKLKTSQVAIPVAYVGYQNHHGFLDVVVTLGE